jgi:hypothetical protein
LAATRLRATSAGDEYGDPSMHEREVQSDARDVALSMIKLHGLRAQAVAMERVAEMRQQGDLSGHDRWQQVHAAICELRQTHH